MINVDLEKEVLVSGTGKKYKFDSNLYMNAVKYLMKNFKLTIEEAKGQLNYFIVSHNGIYDTKKSTTNCRLKNIVDLKYSWKELFWN